MLGEARSPACKESGQFKGAIHAGNVTVGITGGRLLYKIFCEQQDDRVYGNSSGTVVIRINILFCLVVCPISNES